MHRMLTAKHDKLTYRDYCALPDDGRRYEILDGDLRVSPSPMTPHQRVTARLWAIIDAHARRHGLGEPFIAPTDVLLGPHDVIVPDIAFVSAARRSIVTEKNLKGAPDLIVEVLSPNTAIRDKRDKRAIYARAGVRFYWIIDPKRVSILELELADDAYVTVNEVGADDIWRPRLFPKLRVAVSSLWK